MSIQSILAASQSMSKMQAMQSARTQMQGTANVLRMESKQDGGNEKKEAKADGLDEKSNNLMGRLMEESTTVNEAVKPDEEVKAEEKQEEKSKEKDKDNRRDTVTLSDIAAGYRGAFPEIHPTMGEAVTYDAGGGKEPSAPAKETARLEVTV